MKDSLDQALDDLLTRAIVFVKASEGQEGVSLMVHPVVESKCHIAPFEVFIILLNVITYCDIDTDTSIYLSSILLSLTEIDSINMQLSRLKKNVMKHLIVPLLQHRENWRVTTVTHEGVLTLRTIPYKEDNGKRDSDGTCLAATFANRTPPLC
jgi:hypothetical protein